MQTMHELWPQTEALASLEDLIEEHAEELARNGGDLEAIPAIAAFLAFEEDKFLAELERWALKVQALLADAQAVKIERERLEAKERRWTKAAESLKAYMVRQMVARSVKKHKTPLVTISAVRNSQPSVRAASESTLEELFAVGSPLVRQVIELKLDSKAAIAAAEAGELPEGVTVQVGTHVRIA